MARDELRRDLSCSDSFRRFDITMKRRRSRRKTAARASAFSFLIQSFLTLD